GPEAMEMPMGGFGAPPAGIRKLTDGALTCEQIYAESRALEKSSAEQQAVVDAAQREAAQAQEAMMRGARGSTMSGMASGLLGSLPGVGLVGGLAAQASMTSRMAAAQEGTTAMTQAYQRVASASQSMAYAQARNDHLVGMFLQKGCKTPDAAGTAAAGNATAVK
ncbi:MAG: hypothetical protein ABW051_05795, partial [Burkholderiaceae bacterium]